MPRKPTTRTTSLTEPRAGPNSSIKVVSAVTGIPMGTLRIWERRYGFPKPSRRADSNRREYPREQIERLQAVAAALGRGFRPGDVIHKSMSELKAFVGLPAPLPSEVRNSARPVANVPMLLALLAAEDVKGIEDQLRFAAAALGAKRFVTDLAQPLASAVGEAWAAGQLAIRHEHVMTECLTTQLRSLLATHQIADGSPTVLLATLPGEPHTLGLQMVALYLALSAAEPRLMGANTPPEQVLAAAESFGAEVIGLAVTPAADLPVTRQALSRLARDTPASVALWLGGGAGPQLGTLPARFQALLTWSEIDAALQRVRARSQR